MARWNCKYIEYNGDNPLHKGLTLSLEGWSKRLGIHRRTIIRRLELDWPIDVHLSAEDAKKIRAILRVCMLGQKFEAQQARIGNVNSQKSR